MTDKAALEEIEARLAECDEGRRDVLTGGYGVRLLEICREQGARIQAAFDLIGQHGCDCTEDMSDDRIEEHECFPGKIECALKGIGTKK